MKWLRRRWKAVLVGAVVAFLLTLVMLNLAGPEERIERKVPHQYGIADPQFLREIGTMLGPPVLPGNAVQNLENGDQIFPSMLEAIRGAQQSITFETYIYWSGDIGREFAEALAERSRAGVKVHVLIDWIGSQKMDDELIDLMKSADVEVEFFHPLRWYHVGRMNNRTHRKLLVVDGKVGFTGGVGIADIWTGHAQDPEHWRDSHYRIEGPAAAQMQGAFVDNWIKTTGGALHGERYFPPLEPQGDAPAQIFTSSPHGGADSMMLMYLMAIASSEHTIDLSASYFVPDELTSRVMEDALARGVRIRIIVPGPHIDTGVVRRASRASWGRFMEAGAEIYEYEPTMFHCKMLIADKLLVSVGSTNFDNRSFRLNDEANLNVYDREFAEKVTAVFEEDLKRCRRISLEEWRNRPLREKIVENAAALLSPQL